MRIELKEITVKELTDGYHDNNEAGVVGFGGKLDIRPPYQREFIYKDKQRDAVINTVRKDFPLNVMYWAVREDGGFEVIDGQQRTISLCQSCRRRLKISKAQSSMFVCPLWVQTYRGVSFFILLCPCPSGCV